MKRPAGRRNWFDANTLKEGRSTVEQQFAEFLIQMVAFPDEDGGRWLLNRT